MDLALKRWHKESSRFVGIYIIKLKITGGIMVLFGLPLTGTRTTETNLYTLYLRSVPRGFFKVWEAPYDKRGEQLCTTQVKGTTLDTDEGKRHPRCFAKGPENNEREKKGAPQWDVLGIFSSTRSAHDYRIKLHKNTHSRGNKNKKKQQRRRRRSHIEVWAVRPDGSGSMTTRSFCSCLVSASNMFSVQTLGYQSHRCRRW